MKWSVVIPAGGEGKRFGRAKQYELLSGKPLIVHSIAPFLQHPAVNAVVVAVAKQQLDSIKKDLTPFFERDIVSFVEGGLTRGESVYNGLQAVGGSDFVAIHDAARPCLSVDLLDRLMQQAPNYDGVIPGFRLRDTVKTCKNSHGVVDSTADRSKLWAVQTPQCFKYTTIMNAYERALAKGNAFELTDDAAIVEQAGGEVAIVEGESRNIKVTYPEDFRIAELYRGGANV